MKSKYPKIQLLAGAGGWAGTSEKFSKISNNAATRKTFAQSVASYLKTYNLDGFEFHWKYPDTKDKNNLVLQLTEFRNAFGNKYSLSIFAAPQKVYAKGYDIPQISKIVDFINLKTHENHGGWEKKTNLISPLYGDSMCIDNGVQYWISQGAPNAKLNIGIPTYGQVFTLTSSSTSIGSPTTTETTQLPYCQINCRGNWQKVFALTQKVSYAYSGKQWVSYDDTTSVMFKADYIKNMGLGGCMFWSLDTDDYKNKCKNVINFPLIRGAYSILVVQEATTKAPTQRKFESI